MFCQKSRLKQRPAVHAEGSGCPCLQGQKCYDGNRLGDGIGWGGGAGKISEDCPRWMDGWCEAVKWEMGMSLAGGEGARERRRGRSPMGGEEQGGTLCGLWVRVTVGVLGGNTQKLGSDVV